MSKADGRRRLMLECRSLRLAYNLAHLTTSVNKGGSTSVLFRIHVARPNNNNGNLSYLYPIQLRISSAGTSLTNVESKAAELPCGPHQTLPSRTPAGCCLEHRTDDARWPYIKVPRRSEVWPGESCEGKDTAGECWRYNSIQHSPRDLFENTITI